jgi:hypothetical protein
MMRDSPQFIATQKMSTVHELLGLAAAPTPTRVTRLLLKLPSLHLEDWRKSKNALFISSIHNFTVYEIFKSYLRLFDHLIV